MKTDVCLLQGAQIMCILAIANLLINNDGTDELIWLSTIIAIIIVTIKFKNDSINQ